MSVERMENFGEYLVDGYQVNYTYGLENICKKYIDQNTTMLELGVNNGVSTNLFSKYAKSVIAVDFVKTDKFEKVLTDNLNITFYQMFFSDFFKKNKLKFDLIYIDGSHEYEDVKQDIIESLKHVKEGGIISGHDYNSKSIGVIQAVNEFFNNVEIYEDSSWLKKL